MRTSALLPCMARLHSAQSVHDYYPFAMENGGRLAPMAAELVVDRRFRGMGSADSRSLRCGSNARMQHFVRRPTCVPFRRILVDVRREFMQRLFAAPHGT
jgi:hypothetical protein